MIEETWDLMATDYEGFTNKMSSYSNAIEWPAVKMLLPELKNKDILDLGCGTGRFAFYFCEYLPRKVIGIDISSKMIEIAKKKNTNNSVEFIKCSALDISIAIKQKFDFIFSSTTSHYFSNIQDVFLSIYNSLNNDGVFILSAMHPMYTAEYPINKNDNWELKYQNKQIREYLQPWTEFGESKNGVVCQSYQYTFSDYINALVVSGFDILEVNEPLPPDEWKINNLERYESIFNQPIYLLIKAIKRKKKFV